MIGHGADAQFGVPFYTASGHELMGTHAHNLYLQFFYEAGLIGLLLLMSMIFCAFLVIIKNREDEIILQLAILLLFALTVFWADVQNFITGTRQYWILYWLPSGLLIGFYEKNRC